MQMNHTLASVFTVVGVSFALQQLQVDSIQLNTYIYFLAHWMFTVLYYPIVRADTCTPINLGLYYSSRVACRAMELRRRVASIYELS